ncbi:Uncharacterized protein GBIM_22091, partial [Gryllus bimaculatus]
MASHSVLVSGPARVPAFVRHDLLLQRLIWQRRQGPLRLFHHRLRVDVPHVVHLVNVCMLSYVLRHRIMVAEFVARQSGSPINGETPSLNSTMPGSHSASNSTSGGGGGGGGAGAAGGPP